MKALEHKVKKLIPLTLVFFWGFVLSSYPQEQAFKEVSLVVNIEVPVRVYDDSIFVDDLTINDFEILEEGIPQKIEAVYLIKKMAVERSEEKRRFSPDTKRNYFLYFEVAAYQPRIGEGLEFFINNIFSPQDDLYITTPLQTYRMKDGALGIKSKEEIVKELIGIIRGDTEQGNQEYRESIRFLRNISQKLAVSLGASPSQSTSAPVITLPRATPQDETLELEMLLLQYSDVLAKLENLRRVDQIKLLDFAKYLKNRMGQKYVYMFYQSEFIPQVDSRIVSQFESLYQDNPAMLQRMSSLFDFFTREKSFDVDKVKMAYSDASTSIHFLFLTERPLEEEGVRMVEHSEDIYSAFREMAKATGGLVVSSRNPAYAFRQALDASENYYLLYYRPKDYIVDGKFKEIKVRVKGKKYKVIHRAGYFSN
jgi:phage gp36-like protein